MQNVCAVDGHVTFGTKHILLSLEVRKVRLAELILQSGVALTSVPVVSDTLSGSCSKVVDFAGK